MFLTPTPIVMLYMNSMLRYNTNTIESFLDKTSINQPELPRFLVGLETSTWTW